MTLSLPSYVVTALTCLEQAGFEAFVVGGCVRDGLRGVVPHDWDIATAASPAALCRVFDGFPVVETGLRHGTLTVLIEEHPLEITTYRIDGAYSDGRHPDSVSFSSRLQDDLSRRDFTVNAMAYHPAVGLVDPFDGQADLSAHILRCVGDPAVRFEEDALRILRALRFAATLNFTIEPTTAAALQNGRAKLSSVSAERIAQEWMRMLGGDTVADVLREFPSVAFTVLPELAPTYRFDQNNVHHCHDVWEHTLHALAATPPDPVLRFAVLFHDSGKPAACTLGEDGMYHFGGHAVYSKQLAAKAMERLRFSRADTQTVLQLIERHDLPIDETDAGVRWLLFRLGVPLFWQLLALREADHKAQSPAFYPKRQASDAAIRAIAQGILSRGDCFSLDTLAIDGNALIALGVPRGPYVGELLTALLTDVINGRCENTPEALTALAQIYRNTQKTLG